jgi:hypothetical protein
VAFAFADQLVAGNIATNDIATQQHKSNDREMGRRRAAATTMLRDFRGNVALRVCANVKE